MLNYRYISICMIYCFIHFSFTLSGQNERQQQALLQLSEEFKLKFELEKAEAIQFANRLGLPLRQELEDGTVIELMRLENGRPIYYTTCNANGAAYINSDKVYPGGSAGLSLTGSGQTLGIWDEAKVLATHQELTGRVTQMDTPLTFSDHATHVAGTMIASGVTAQAKGMSYQASLHAYDWNNDFSEMATAAAGGLKVSQHSYGEVTGWYYGNLDAGNAWYWLGDPSISTVEDYKFGFYNIQTQDVDEIAHNAPHYLIVKSAGNDRDDDPGNVGHYVWIGETWVWSTAARNGDGGTLGYDCIPIIGTGKNLLTIGAVTNTGAMAYFSSWGPTDDGRVKPDVVAKGTGVYSSGSESNTKYVYKSGTSMSGPMVSGSVGLLLHHQENLHPGIALLSSTIKALIIHTADEMISGAHGPDYRFGWGLMDTEAAAAVMSDNAAKSGSHIYELVLNDGEEITIPVKSSGTEPLKATIVWTDVPGTPPVPSLNPTDLMLVNDLDMRLTATDGTEYKPYILDPSDPSLAATTGDNFRDNVEKINIQSPGNDKIYLLTIRHKGNLSGGSQQLSLILTGNDPFEYTSTTLASDQSSNYSSWSDNSSRGFGFDPWELTSGGSGGSYLGSTGLGSNTFGIYSGGTGTGNYFVAQRDFEEVMPVSATFSINIGHTGVATDGNIGISLFSDEDFRLTFKFVGGNSEWVINDGGSDFGTGISWAGTTTHTFEFTRGNGNNYTLRVLRGSNIYSFENYTSSSGTMAINRIEIFSTGQGSGENVGFDNLNITPDIYSLPNTSSLLVNTDKELTQHLTLTDLLIADGRKFQVNSGANLTVTGELSNLNTSGKSGAGLIIQSDATGTGSLIHNTNDVPATVQRFIAEAETWRLISSPVAAQEITGAWTPAGTYEGGTGYDFFAWSEPHATWANFKNTTVSPTFTFVNGNSNFTPGRGYLVSYQLANQTKEFVENLNNGNVEIPVVKTGTDDFAGSNLIGNPYPSGIDWNAANRTLFADDFAYVYNRVAEEEGVTEGYLPVDGSAPDAFIAAHQGFFVIKEGDGSNNFTFTNAMRAHGGTFTKDGSIDNKLVLNLSQGNYFDQTTIRIRENSLPERDRSDAIKIFSYNAQVPQLYSKGNDAVNFAINSIPAVNESTVIPVSIKAPANGSMTITLKELSGGFEGLFVMLLDQKTGVTHKFVNYQDGYTFNASTTDTDRFLLKFEMVGIGENPLNNQTAIYTHGRTIYLKTTESVDAIISVYNITGQRVYGNRLMLDGLKQITLNLPTGWYVVQAVTSESAVSRKVFIQ